MLRAGRRQGFLRMLNRFMLRMLTQKYTYVKRYFYVLEGQGDTGSGAAAAGSGASSCAGRRTIAAQVHSWLPVDAHAL